MRKLFQKKIKESVLAIVPISVIVLVLHFAVAPLSEGMLAAKLVGMVMLLAGMTLFLIGVEMFMLPVGRHVGAALISAGKLPLVVVALFVFGSAAAIAEPDISVLANQVASIPTPALMAGISAGIGVLLVVALLRVVFHWKLRHVLAILYPLAFLMVIFSSDYLPVAVDAAAVATGHVTVPFFLAIGSGFTAAAKKREPNANSFGISAVCAVGPIISVLILGMFFDLSGSQYQAPKAVAAAGEGQLAALFGHNLWHSVGEVMIIIAPILAAFLLFHIVKLKLSRSELRRLLIGFGYLLVGKVLFLTGINAGLLPAAVALGESIGALEHNWILIPIVLVIGMSVVLAEPAVHVLVDQVEELTYGTIPQRLLLPAVALGGAIAMLLSILRILFGFSVLWILLPGYAVSLTLSFFTPDIFVGIGFDAGEAATGALSAAFVIPFAIGVCSVMP
jgi:hypothetical protein